MIPIRYRIGDATQPVGFGRKIIAHVCNDYGGWGAGFVLALSKRSMEPEYSYRMWSKQTRLPTVLELGVPFVLGEIRLAPFIDKPNPLDSVYVANMIAQNGNHVDYVALDDCLTKLRNLALVAGASIHMPRIGCGLGGGLWEVVETIILKRLSAYNVDVVVYDLPPAPKKLIPCS